MEGDGAVFAEGVGIEEEAGRGVVASFGGVEDGLVFKSFAAEEKVAMSVALRACAGLVVVEFFEFVKDGLSGGDLSKEAEGALVLCVVPRLDFFGAASFEPSVGIADGSGVVGVGDGLAACGDGGGEERSDRCGGLRRCRFEIG